MTPNEKKAVARLVRHMQQLQRTIKEPTNDLATDEEVITLLRDLHRNPEMIEGY